MKAPVHKGMTTGKLRQSSAPTPPSFKCALVLQGGGALGSYQAGVYEALTEAGVRPDWVAGISIGSINAAIIAGNAPGMRLQRLREFWELASSSLLLGPLTPGEPMRSLFNEASASWIAAFGVPGFFSPRVPAALLYPPGAAEALSIYDTQPLRSTLERLVDFDRVNGKATRLSLGAVNIRTGNFAYFDNMRERIGPEHVMASGALPPGFPPIEIEGQHYWDGGIVSNTPLQYVLDEEETRDLQVFQVDLFSARGPMPRTLLEAAEREKDIRFSSRTRLNTDANLKLHRVKAALRTLIDRIPGGLLTDSDLALLRNHSTAQAVTVVQLIYRSRKYEGNSKGYEFSRSTMLEHWAAGKHDAQCSVCHPDWVTRTPPVDGVAVFDLTRSTRENPSRHSPRRSGHDCSA